jgi:predicted anti-sigma-YlaC factor YlaD
VTVPVVEDRDCVQARRALCLALDGEAAGADCLVAVTHISRCERCRLFVVHVGVLTRVLRSARVT